MLTFPKWNDTGSIWNCVAVVKLINVQIWKEFAIKGRDSFAGSKVMKNRKLSIRTVFYLLVMRKPWMKLSRILSRTISKGPLL